MRLIDADALANALFEKRKNYPQWVADTIGNMPTVDADAMLKEQEAVVRCKDCKFYPDGKGTTKWLPCREIIVPPMWFCADGKRKEE